MKAIQPLLLATACLLTGAVWSADDGATPSDTRQSFNLVAPTEFQGEWNREYAPFLHPINTHNWVNVRVEKIDPNDGSVSGHFDVYVRNICDDVVDQPFKGSFDGKVRRLSYDYTQCPGMQPLRLALWKEADGFHGRTMGLPIIIRSPLS